MGRFNSFVAGALVATLSPLAAWAGPVDVNTADAATLARELQGVGISRAEAIVAHRQENGPFEAVEDLLEVKGIGPQIIEQNRANIRLDDRPGSGSAAGGR